MHPVRYKHNAFKVAVFDKGIYYLIAQIFLKEPLQDGLKEITDFAKIYVLSHFDRLEDYDPIQKRLHDGKISGVFASR
jgi:tRNA (Thr-GGU) A37 N-methylase